MPAKLKLTYALVEQIVELKRDGLCDADIIAAIGVHQATFYRWLKEGENAKTGVKRALYEELKKAEAAVQTLSLDHHQVGGGVPRPVLDGGRLAARAQVPHGVRQDGAQGRGGRQRAGAADARARHRAHGRRLRRRGR